VIQIAYAMNAAHARAEGERAAELARRRAELLERVAAARRLVARAAEEEREQVAADIHDGAVQDLAGLLFTTRALEARLASGEDVGPEEFAHYVEYCQAVAGTASRELQSMVVELDPPLLAEAGLAAAVGQLVAGVDSGVTCHVDCAHDPGEARLQRLVYRAVREAYRNIVKHAKCQNVWITVAAEADQVVATVRDDGRGFSAEERARRLEQGHNGLGLLERTAALQGARVTIVSAPGQGTTVTLAAPLLGPGRRVGALAAPPLAARTAA
jgi:signal transduction histidine kinase